MKDADFNDGSLGVITVTKSEDSSVSRVDVEEEFLPCPKQVKSEAIRLRLIFGSLSEAVCDELLSAAHGGYDLTKDMKFLYTRLLSLNWLRHSENVRRISIRN